MVFATQISENGEMGRYMIDFTNAIQKNKAYAGANDGKIAVVYNDEQYMLKFLNLIRKEETFLKNILNSVNGR